MFLLIMHSLHSSIFGHPQFLILAMPPFDCLSTVHMVTLT